jgi:hypothetical protein
MGIVMGVFKQLAITAPRSTMRKQTPGRISGITGIINLRRRPSTWGRGHVLGALYRPQRTRLRPSCVPQRTSKREPGATGARSHRAHYGAHATSASSASSAQLQAFIGQGEFLFSYFIEILKNYSFTLYSFPGCHTLYSTLERSWAAAGFPVARLEWSRLRSEVRVSGTKICGSKHCLVLT